MIGRMVFSYTKVPCVYLCSIVQNRKKWGGEDRELGMRVHGLVGRELVTEDFTPFSLEGLTPQSYSCHLSHSQKLCQLRPSRWVWTQDPLEKTPLGVIFTPSNTWIKLCKNKVL